jgi:Leucine-rich repeat (LRR) protein
MQPVNDIDENYIVRANGESVYKISSRIIHVCPSFDFIRKDRLVDLRITFTCIRELPQLPDTIHFLDIQDNLLEHLGILPRSLETLICSNNRLRHLHISAENTPVLNNVSCEKNNIETLELPDTVTFLNARHNKISEIRKLPELLRILHIENNQLTELTHLPKNLHVLNCAHNLLTHIENMHDLSKLYYINCADNQIKHIELPERVHHVNVRNNFLETIDHFPDFIILLNVSNNLIQHIGRIPTKVEDLSISKNQITELSAELFYGLSDLSRFSCKHNLLKSIDYLPDSIEYLYCSENQIKELYLPSQIMYIYASNNLIEQIPELPNTVRILVLNNNPLIYPFQNNDIELIKKIHEYNKENQPMYVMK